MTKTNAPPVTPTEMVISIVGADMTVEGDCETDGSLRIEGTIRGNVRAGKSVVIGKGGSLEGSIYTQEAVIGGRVLGAVYAESYLELLATSEISGEIQAQRMHLEDGAVIQGQVAVGEGGVMPGRAPSGQVGKAPAADNRMQSYSSLRGAEEIPWRQLLIRDHDSFGLRPRPVSQGDD